MNDRYFDNAKFDGEKLLDFLIENNDVSAIEFYTGENCKAIRPDTVIITEDSKNKKADVFIDRINDTVRIYSPAEVIQFPENSEGLFYKMGNLERFDTSKANISMNGVKNISHLFEGCKKLESVDFSEMVFEDLEDMSYAFKDCESLKDVKIGNSFLSIEKATELFAGCTSLEEVDVSPLFQTNIPERQYMFYKDENLKSAKLGDITAKDLSLSFGMFDGCQNLKKLDIGLNGRSLDTFISELQENIDNINEFAVLDDKSSVYDWVMSVASQEVER